MEKLIIDCLYYNDRNVYDRDKEKIVDILTTIFELRANERGLSELSFRSVQVGDKYEYNDRMSRAERNQEPLPPSHSDLF